MMNRKRRLIRRDQICAEDDHSTDSTPIARDHRSQLDQIRWSSSDSDSEAEGSESGSGYDSTGDSESQSESESESEPGASSESDVYSIFYKSANRDYVGNYVGNSSPCASEISDGGKSEQSEESEENEESEEEGEISDGERKEHSERETKEAEFQRFILSNAPFQSVQWRKWKEMYFNPMLRRGCNSQERTKDVFIGHMQEMDDLHVVGTSLVGRRKCFACGKVSKISFEIFVNGIKRYELGTQCGNYLKYAINTWKVIWNARRLKLKGESMKTSLSNIEMSMNRGLRDVLEEDNRESSLKRQRYR